MSMNRRELVRGTVSVVTLAAFGVIRLSGAEHSTKVPRAHYGGGAEQWLLETGSGAVSDGVKTFVVASLKR